MVRFSDFPVWLGFALVAACRSGLPGLRAARYVFDLRRSTRQSSRRGCRFRSARGIVPVASARSLPALGFRCASDIRAL